MLSGSIFINRGNNKSAVGMMQAAAQEMKRKKVSGKGTMGRSRSKRVPRTQVTSCVQ